MHTRSYFLAPAMALLLFVSCEKEENKGGSYSEGVFIVNEGSFMANNGSVSFYNPVNDSIVNNLFEMANERPLGDVVQSMGIANGKAYIVVNGSGKVEIVNLENFETAAEPIVASYPRYFMAANDRKGYLSNGSMQGLLYCIDLEADIITDSIQVGYGPETMVYLNEKLYVANSGGWGLDSTVSIVNTNTDAVIGQVVVGDVPVDMALDRDNNIWVYCKGYAVYDWNTYALISETSAKLVKINTETNTVSSQYVIGTAGDYSSTPAKLAVNATGDILYFIRPDGIYKMYTVNPEIPDEPYVIGSYYGLDVSPQTGDLYLFQTSFTGNGNLIIVNAENGEKTNFVVGIGPNSAVYNVE